MHLIRRAYTTKIQIFDGLTHFSAEFSMGPEVFLINDQIFDPFLMDYVEKSMENGFQRLNFLSEISSE